MLVDRGSPMVTRACYGGAPPLCEGADAASCGTPGIGAQPGFGNVVELVSNLRGVRCSHRVLRAGAVFRGGFGIYFDNLNTTNYNSRAILGSV